MLNFVFSLNFYQRTMFLHFQNFSLELENAFDNEHNIPHNKANESPIVRGREKSEYKLIPEIPTYSYIQRGKNFTA